MLQDKTLTELLDMLMQDAVAAQDPDLGELAEYEIADIRAEIERRVQGA